MEYYESYIGSLSVNEFLKPFNGNIVNAVNNVIDTWPWPCQIPDGFMSVIVDYCTNRIFEDQEDA